MSVLTDADKYLCLISFLGLFDPLVCGGLWLWGCCVAAVSPGITVVIIISLLSSLLLMLLVRTGMREEKGFFLSLMSFNTNPFSRCFGVSIKTVMQM